MGFSYTDQTTSGPVNSRVDNYLNRSAFESSGPYFGNLGRNTVFGPDQRRIDMVLSKMTRVSEKTSLEFRAEYVKVTSFCAARQLIFGGGALMSLPASRPCDYPGFVICPAGAE